jgi:drug/metabolite transporter (DMT)-like permease
MKKVILLLLLIVLGSIASTNGVFEKMLADEALVGMCALFIFTGIASYHLLSYLHRNRTPRSVGDGVAVLFYLWMMLAMTMESTYTGKSVFGGSGFATYFLFTTVVTFFSYYILRGNKITVWELA